MTSRRIPSVAIVGRTNVGKSTLFNAIFGHRASIVEDTHGVTRDRHYVLVKRFGAPFTLIDTGGLAGEQDRTLEDAVRIQSEIAIQECDLAIVVFDGIQGVHPHDHEVVELLRKSSKPILWVVNKCEGKLTKESSADFYTLGLDELTTVSAAHLQGVRELVSQIYTKLELDPTAVTPMETDKNPEIAVAVLGRPNVGKSSLVNRILGEERVIASDQPGTTRDNIDIELIREGQRFRIVDTAGLRKKSKVEDLTIERFANLRSLKALAACDVAILVLDATQGAPSEQDSKIAGLIHERGRPFVIVVNKWDAIEKDHRAVKQFTDAIHNEFKFSRYAPILFVSALSGRRCPHILQTAATVFTEAKTRIATSEINNILETAFHQRPPPVHRGEPIKLYFATQVSVLPPTIVLFVNHPKYVNFSYVRYLKNCLRKHYAFSGSDIKIQLRKRESKHDKLEANG